ncbi:MAG: helix-turn-helix domain-containing protein [Cyanobacteria bacterium P01_D01_bin.1]
MNPRSLTPEKQQLVDQYSYCRLGMTPQAFYNKWQVSYEQLAAICSRSVSTVRCWFSKGSSYRRPSATDLRHLAVMDFLLDYFDQFPEELKEALCDSPEEG